MKLGHLNLTVTDVPATRDFLATYFDMSPAGGRGAGFAALTDDDGMVLTLMRGKEVDYPATFHIGFFRGSEAEVDALHQRLTADGFVADPPMHAHAYTFYVEAPGGFTVEVMC